MILNRPIFSLFCLIFGSLMISVSNQPGYSQENLPEVSSSISGQQLWRRFFPNSESPDSESKRGSSEGGARGGFCPIAPNQFSQAEWVWNERLTFTWVGVLTQVEIREQGNKKVVWSQDISAKNRIELNPETASSTPLKLYQVTTGTSLKPGQVYELQVSTTPPIAYRPILFQIMTSENRDLMTQGLQELERELKTKNITGDAAKLRRADYFASQKLWSEFWQEVLSINTASEDLKTLINQTVNQLC
ncbi:MAG: hypothetical protein AAFO04_22615 [Cyanobacteria bacterium J06592_8]